jgi:hypothetical protein
MPDFSADWRRALEPLAKSADGCTTSLLLTHGFALQASQLQRASASGVGQRTVDVTRVRITDRGRAALEQ